MQKRIESKTTLSNECLLQTTESNYYASVPGARITSRNCGNLNRVSPPRGSRTKMVMSFKAGNLLRFAEALVTISIYANAFTADAQVAQDIASTSASASATLTLNLRVPVMPGGTPPLASHAPSVGPFELEVTSLENRRIEFSQRPIIFYGSSSIRRWKTLSQDFIGYADRHLLNHAR
jgi:hypothetical protein